MIQYYRLPKKKGLISHKQQLHIIQQADLKDAIYNNSLNQIKILSFKNSNIRQSTLSLFSNLNTSLPVIQLDLSQNFSFISDQTIASLVKLNIFPHLKKINLADNHITDESIIEISTQSNMLNLQQLILFGNMQICGEGLIILGQSKTVKNIKSIDLHATSIQDAAIVEYLKFQNTKNLQNLNLSMNWNRITDKTLLAISTSPFCKKIKILQLQDCKITDKGIDILSESQNSSCLEVLNLNNSIKQKNNIITDKSLASIELSKHLINLKILELRNTEITSKGLRKMSVSLAVQKIQQLRLSYCLKIDEQVLTYLQKIAKYLSLKKVYLTATKIDQQAFKQFQLQHPQINLIF